MSEHSFKIMSEETLAQVLCIYNGIALTGHDGSPEWWMFSDTAKKMLANKDGALELELSRTREALRVAINKVEFIINRAAPEDTERWIAALRKEFQL